MTAAVRVANISRIIEVQRSLNALAEAIMEVRRAYFEQHNLITLNGWLAEWTARAAEYRRLQESGSIAADTEIREVNATRFSELRDLLEATNEAQRQFDTAFDYGNHPLFVRWLEEWKSRRESWERCADRWLQDFPSS